jgi:glutamate-1-semialdehyde 2,1-aminomutase
VAPGGAQEYYRVYPDITVVSKALGGGFPVSAFGAAREHMQVIANGSMFHGGVFSGNALVMAAAEAVLDEILASGQAMYEHLHALGDQLAGGVCDLFRRLRIPHLVQHVGPLISIFLTTHDQPRITNYRDVRRYCVAERYIRFQHQMQRAGVYFHPNQFEPLFLSTAHTRGDLEVVLERMEDAARCCLTA